MLYLYNFLISSPFFCLPSYRSEKSSLPSILLVFPLRYTFCMMLLSFSFVSLSAFIQASFLMPSLSAAFLFSFVIALSISSFVILNSSISVISSFFAPLSASFILLSSSPSSKFMKCLIHSSSSIPLSAVFLYCLSLLMYFKTSILSLIFSNLSYSFSFSSSCFSLHNFMCLHFISKKFFLFIFF